MSKFDYDKEIECQEAMEQRSLLMEEFIKVVGILEDMKNGVLSVQLTTSGNVGLYDLEDLLPDNKYNHMVMDDLTHYLKDLGEQVKALL